MKSRSLFFLIFLLFVIILGSVYYWQIYLKRQPTDILSKVSLGPGDALVVVDFGADKPKRFFTGKVVDGMTLFDALKVSAAAGHLDLELAGKVGEEKVVKIDGLADGPDGGLWHYYRFSAEISQPLSAQLVSPGDRFKFVYEPR